MNMDAHEHKIFNKN